MPMKKLVSMLPNFSLAVQYACTAPELPRWRIRRWVAKALEQALADEPEQELALTIRIVDLAEAKELNLTWRERDYATNVLTFEYGADPDNIIHGDIVLCLAVLQREAAEQGKPLLHHAAHLVTHGVLHALGYDHIQDDEAIIMEALETKILAKQRIPDPYMTI